MLKVRSSFYLQGFCLLLLELELRWAPPCYQLSPDVARCPLFEGNQLRISLHLTALNRAQLWSLLQALTWVQPHVAQPVLLCAQDTVRQLRELQQGA
jgi:hypothetical protein